MHVIAEFNGMHQNFQSHLILVSRGRFDGHRVNGASYNSFETSKAVERRKRKRRDLRDLAHRQLPRTLVSEAMGIFMSLYE